jgi:hypothetical protein
MGRPVKEFAACCSKAKKIKTEEMRKSATTEELAYATKLSLYRDNKRSAAQIVSQLPEASPDRLQKIKQVLGEASQENKFVSYRPEEALALIMDCRLTKQAYQILREGAKKRGVDLYPSYDKVLSSKNECYPDLDAIRVDDYGE